MATPSPRTLLGPLTTTWTAPPICSYAMALCDTCTTVWQGQTCNPVSHAHDYTECWPPRSGAQATVDPGVMMGWGLYSPGIVCPAGYSTAAMATEGGSSGWGVEYSMLPGETAAACCPSGFSISSISASNTLAQTCVTTATSATFVTVQCDSGTFAEFTAVTVPATVSGETLSSYVIFAPLYQLNFQASDLPATTTPPTSSPTSPTSSPTSTPLTVPPTSTPSPTSRSSSSGAANGSSPTAASEVSAGLSSGAKAGVGVGVTLGALLLIALAIFFFRRRQKKQEAGDAATAGTSAPGGWEAGARSDEKGAVGGSRPTTDAGSGEVGELDGRALVISELPTRLPSGRRPPRRNGPVFRRSDPTWVVSPADETSGGGRDIVSPVEPHGDAVFELEGDTTPNSTVERR